ncbi:hypothetical protein Hanom_Chr03g00207901 [Helianthus anomalus]
MVAAHDATDEERERDGGERETRQGERDTVKRNTTVEVSNAGQIRVGSRILFPSGFDSKVSLVVMALTVVADGSQIYGCDSRGRLRW